MFCYDFQELSDLNALWQLIVRYVICLFCDGYFPMQKVTRF